MIERTTKIAFIGYLKKASIGQTILIMGDNKYSTLLLFFFFLFTENITITCLD